MPQEKQSVECVVHKTQQLSYLRYLPDGYGDDPNKKWPLILFLHGAGERGDDLEMIKKHGIARVVETQELPFITISPQCPINHWWSDFHPALDALLTQAVEEMAVDPRRIYLTGLSMGGFGTWHLAAAFPQRFAAIAPICGAGPWMYGFPDRANEIAHIPAWVFHGALDEVVPLAGSEMMVEALRACGSDPRFTVYPDALHDSWTATYNDPALYEWFLSHQIAG
jgi:predicted peptidase